MTRPSVSATRMTSIAFDASFAQGAPLIKVCGITRQLDVERVEAAACHMIGFIFARKSPRYIAPANAACLMSTRVKRVGVFTDTPPEEICFIMNLARLDYAQLHGEYTEDDCDHIGKERVIRVLWPQRYQIMQEFCTALHSAARSAALLLLDAGLAGGGSGVALDWNKILPATCPAPTLLAGGISSHNMLQAWQSGKHCLIGLDMNSGVEERPGIKSAALLASVARSLATIQAGQTAFFS